jgi:hypothetical protein
MLALARVGMKKSAQNHPSKNNKPNFKEPPAGGFLFL